MRNKSPNASQSSHADWTERTLQRTRLHETAIVPVIPEGHSRSKAERWDSKATG